MFITRECDYAIRMIRALAGTERLSVTDICEQEDLTPAFAYKIMKKLEKCGFVKGFRGNQGGYLLTVSLEQISLLSILQAIDPEISMISCPKKGEACSRNKPESPCKVHAELCRIDEILQAQLAAKSIKEILQ